MSWVNYRVHRVCRSFQQTFCCRLRVNGFRRLAECVLRWQPSAAGGKANTRNQRVLLFLPGNFCLGEFVNNTNEHQQKFFGNPVDVFNRTIFFSTERCSNFSAVPRWWKASSWRQRIDKDCYLAHVCVNDVGLQKNQQVLRR